MDSQSPEQNQKEPADQRYFPRWNVNNRVLYKSESDPDHSLRHGHTKDLSGVGACLYLKEFLPPCQKITLGIHLSPKATIDLRATVVWQKAEDLAYLTGVAFYETSDEAQQLILEHAFELDRKKLLEHWYKGWDGGTT